MIKAKRFAKHTAVAIAWAVGEEREKSYSGRLLTAPDRCENEPYIQIVPKHQNKTQFMLRNYQTSIFY